MSHSPPSRHPIAPSHPIPPSSRGSKSSARRPKKGERAPNKRECVPHEPSSHVHRSSRDKISGECLASSGERTATGSYSDMIRSKSQKKSRKQLGKSL